MAGVKTSVVWKKEVEEEKVLSYACNKCGKKVDAANPVERNKMNHFKVWGGYGSTFPQDNDCIVFDVCGTCLLEWTESFKHPVELL